MDLGNSLPDSLMSVPEMYRAAKERNLSIIFGIYSMKDIQKSGFPCSILSDQSMDLSLRDRKAHILKSFNSGELLGDTGKSDVRHNSLLMLSLYIGRSKYSTVQSVDHVFD